MESLFTRQPVFNLENKIVAYSMIHYEYEDKFLGKNEKSNLKDIIDQDYYYEFDDEILVKEIQEIENKRENSSQLCKTILEPAEDKEEIEDKVDENKEIDKHEIENIDESIDEKETFKIPVFLEVDAVSIFDNIIDDIPVNEFIIELKDPITTQDKFINRIEFLKKKGFKICVDDSMLSRETGKLADYIKVDIKDKNIPEINNIIKEVNLDTQKLIAIGVDSDRKFQEAQEYGFTLFQGIYFTKPTIYRGGNVSANIKICVDLLKTINQVDLEKDPKLLSVDLQKIIRIIQTDPVLTYKVIKSANAYRNSTSKKISSVEIAVTMLGFVEISKVLKTALLQEINIKEGKNKSVNREVLYIALIRTKFFEKLAMKESSIRDIQGEIVLTSMVDLFDILFEMPLKDVLRDLNLSEEIKAAVLYGEGVIGDLLCLVKYYETGSWDICKQICHDFSYNFEDISNLYTSAIKDSKDEIEQFARI